MLTAPVLEVRQLRDYYVHNYLDAPIAARVAMHETAIDREAIAGYEASLATLFEAQREVSGSAAPSSRRAFSSANGSVARIESIETNASTANKIKAPV